jgi:hypothetical protein
MLGFLVSISFSLRCSAFSAPRVEFFRFYAGRFVFSPYSVL